MTTLAPRPSLHRRAPRLPWAVLGGASLLALLTLTRLLLTPTLTPPGTVLTVTAALLCASTFLWTLWRCWQPPDEEDRNYELTVTLLALAAALAAVFFTAGEVRAGHARLARVQASYAQLPERVPFTARLADGREARGLASRENLACGFLLMVESGLPLRVQGPGLSRPVEVLSIRLTPRASRIAGALPGEFASRVCGAGTRGGVTLNEVRLTPRPAAAPRG